MHVTPRGRDNQNAVPVDELGEDANAVVEAALLVETGSWKTYDLLMVVWCSRQEQLDRAIARGVDETRAQVLLNAQAPIDQKTAQADVVVDNSGDPDQLEEELDRAWSEIVKGCQRFT